MVFTRGQGLTAESERFTDCRHPRQRARCGRGCPPATCQFDRDFGERAGEMSDSRKELIEALAQLSLGMDESSAAYQGLEQTPKWKLACRNAGRVVTAIEAAIEAALRREIS